MNIYLFQIWKKIGPRKNFNFFYLMVIFAFVGWVSLGQETPSKLPPNFSLIQKPEAPNKLPPNFDLIQKPDTPMQSPTENQQLSSNQNNQNNHKFLPPLETLSKAQKESPQISSSERALVPVRHTELTEPMKLPEGPAKVPPAHIVSTPEKSSQPTPSKITQKTFAKTTPEAPANAIASPPKVETANIQNSNQEQVSPPRRIISSPLDGPKQEQVPHIKTVTIPTKVLSPEVAIILANDQFHPSHLRLQKDEEVRLLFTSINKKPAALIIERLNIQTWLPETQYLASQKKNIPQEINREISSSTITTIKLKPESGTYTFHDALSGAKGQIFVK